MSDSDRLLEIIEDALVEHGGDLGGWTRREDDQLQVFDGRVTLRASFHDSGEGLDGTVHAHLLATLHEHDDEVLDACLLGMGIDRETALAEVALIWMTCVAGPIKSFIDGKPLCMTCQTGVEGGDASKGYSPGDYGLPGMRAYVGPSIARGFDDDRLQSQMDDTNPWFRFAAESAAPRRVHIAKSIIVSEGDDGWRRELAIDGHEVSHQDPHWPTNARGPNVGYLMRYAVFEFPRNSTEIRRRSELDRTIRQFAQRFSTFDSVDQLMDEMVQEGFDADLVKEVESVSTIAFGRTLFEQHGVQYASTVIRARRDGRIETDVPLMSLPAYSRARALASELSAAISAERYQTLCLYNAESQAILKAMQSAGDKLDLSKLTMHPSIVPDRGVSDQTMGEAMSAAESRMEKSRQQPNHQQARKPWWKIW